MGAFCKEARRNFRGAGEAGIWLDFGLKTGGRILAEVDLLITGLLLLCMDKLVLGSLAMGLALISFGLRLAKLWRPAQTAQRLGVNHPWLRLLAFEWLTKAHGVYGYWEGKHWGTTHCQDCRRRLLTVAG